VEARSPLPEPGELRKLLNEAATQQNIFAVHWLVAHEAPWPLELHAGWRGECLEYIRDAGCESPMAADMHELLFEDFQLVHQEFADLADNFIFDHMLQLEL
jgi:hypothetical protein